MTPGERVATKVLRWTEKYTPIQDIWDSWEGDEPYSYKVWRRNLYRRVAKIVNMEVMGEEAPRFVDKMEPPSTKKLLAG